jgi:hypothetical protein
MNQEAWFFLPKLRFENQINPNVLPTAISFLKQENIFSCSFMPQCGFLISLFDVIKCVKSWHTSWGEKN